MMVSGQWAISVVKNFVEKLTKNGTLYFRFGLPFVLYMERTVTWDALQKEILEKMRHLLRPGVYIQVGRGTSNSPYCVYIEIHSIS